MNVWIVQKEVDIYNILNAAFIALNFMTKLLQINEYWIMVSVGLFCCIFFSEEKHPECKRFTIPKSLE